MEFIETKMYGSKVNVLFTGKNYLFYNGWYGLFLVAERDYNEEEKDITKGRFTLYVSDNDPRGGDIDDFIKVAKRVINKSECKYVQRVVSYEVQYADVWKWGVNVNIVK